MLRVAALLLAMLLHATAARAQPAGCAPELLRWTERCAASQRFSLQVSACPGDDLAVLSARVGGAPALRIEIAQRPNGFRVINGVALSPIAEFADWQDAPATLRDAFERTARCAQTPLPRAMRGAALPTLSLDARTPPSRRAPWLLGIAAIVAIAFSHKEIRRLGGREWGALLGSVALTLAARAALHPAAYFHQNGQGPLWIEHLFSGGHHPYGPGFAELFALLAGRAPAAPEAAVFALQSLLAAFQPACAWWIARALGASPWVAGALGLAAALDPSLGRGARSESYLALGTSLSLFAAVVVVRARGRWWPLVVAGALLAQAVRVHPALWVPSALVPLCAVATAGSARERALATLRALAVTGAVVALSSASALLTTLRSDLAAQWMSAQSRGGALPWSALFVAALCVTAAALWRATRPASLSVGLVALALTVHSLTDNYARSGSPAWVVASYGRTFLPLILAAVAAACVALPTSARRQPVLGALLALVLVAGSNRHRRALSELPTDVMELQRAWTWRAQLPRGARVFFVSRAGYFVLGLPIHGGAGRNLRALSLDIAEAPPDLRAAGPNTWYYRASTCSTPPARAWCDTLERQHHLTPTMTAGIPAVPSMRHLRYTTPQVRVGLYRVTN